MRTTNSSLRTRAGKGVRQVNEGIPARWARVAFAP
jgi:hypothetical protein